MFSHADAMRAEIERRLEEYRAGEYSEYTPETLHQLFDEIEREVDAEIKSRQASHGAFHTFSGTFALPESSGDFKMTLTLTPESQAFVQSEVASGRFHTASDVVEAAIDLLRHRQESYRLLQEEVRERIASADRGEGIALNSAGMKQLLEEIKVESRQNLAQRKASPK